MVEAGIVAFVPELGGWDPGPRVVGVETGVVVVVVGAALVVVVVSAGVVVVVGCAQPWLGMVLVSRVTAPF